MAVKNGVSLNWGGFDKALSKAGHKLGDTQALMESVGEALVSDTKKRFDAKRARPGSLPGAHWRKAARR